MLAELSDKNADIGRIAERVAADRSLLSEIIDGLKLKVSARSGEETVRYNCFKVLMAIAGTRSELLYREWDRFVQLLKSDNSYYKMAAVQLLAALAKADADNRFDKVFDTYFGLLDDKSMIVAIYVASNAGQIVKTKPGLEPKVTERLLGIEGTHHPPSRKGLIVAGAIQSFNEYFDMLSGKERVLEFVGRQQQADSPKTRKLAAEFLKKWGTVAS